MKACVLCGDDLSDPTGPCGAATIMLDMEPTPICAGEDHRCLVDWVLLGKRPNGEDVDPATFAEEIVLSDQP